MVYKPYIKYESAVAREASNHVGEYPDSLIVSLFEVIFVRIGYISWVSLTGE